MNFAHAILTAPRPQSTLRQTLESLRHGGFTSDFWFHDGSPPDGEATSPRWCTAAYIDLLRRVGKAMDVGKWRPDAEGLLVFEDDVVVCKGLCEYLQSIPWPEAIDQIAAVSPYCPTAYSNYKAFRRWHREDRRVTLAGTQAFLYTRRAMRELVQYLDPERRKDDGEIAGVDVQFGMYAKEFDLHIHYHVPSLVQHIGINNSAVGFGDCGTIYRAETFVGEDFDARSLPCA